MIDFGLKENFDLHKLYLLFTNVHLTKYNNLIFIIKLYISFLSRPVVHNHRGAGVFSGKSFEIDKYSNNTFHFLP